MARTLNAVALVFGEEQLSYLELNARANQLARRLRKLGVNPDVPVGICVERSLAMVIGILGILKAGGAYVPLDPAAPRERLQFLVADAGVRLLLTEAGLAAQLPALGARLVCLDHHADRGAECSDDLPPSACAEHLAYMMYTSGSTGEPKGVCIVHRGVIRLVKNTNYVELGPDEVMLQLAPLSFDASTFEIWGPLLNGGRLVIYPPGPLSLEELGRVIQENHVSTLWLSAGIFHALVDKQIDCFRGLRQLLVGGDVVSPRHAAKVLGRWKHCRLINGYGPTENTTFTCCYPMSSPADVGATVPIGRPIANTQVYVLDQQRRPVPAGASGELYIGGDGLARAYHKRPELTAATFVPNPFVKDPSARLYKTGDLVRWLPDGNLEFLGRMDDQVKIRGFRVEPGETETVLASHPKVNEAIVVAREDSFGDKYLAAYVVARNGETFTAADLRGYLQQKLPEFMVPSAFTTLKTLPLTPNGKVDRRALPAPDAAHPELEQAYVAPRTPLEETLAEIWAEILNLRNVGIHNNFFDLGGHSLVAAKLFACIENAFGKRLPLATLFDHPTIARLARVLRPGQLMKQRALLKVHGEGSRLPLFFSPSAGGEAFFLKPLACRLGADQPIWSFQIPEEGGARKPFHAIEAMAAYFVDDLTRSQMHGPYCLAGYSFGAAVALEMAQQLWARGERVALLAIIDWDIATPRPRTVGRLLNSAWASFCNLPYWLVDDFLLTPGAQRRARLTSELREIVRRVRDPFGNASNSRSGSSPADDRALVPSASESDALEQAHVRALENYKPRPYPGRIMFFPSRTRSLLTSSRAPHFHWAKIAAGGMDLKAIPGNHVSMIHEPFVRFLARELRHALDKADASI